MTTFSSFCRVAPLPFAPTSLPSVLLSPAGECPPSRGQTDAPSVDVH
jgi:hypothetical protein